VLETVLKAGSEAGYATVEAFAEKIVRQETEGGDGPLSLHEARSDRLAVRAFRDSGDPLGFCLSAPDARQVRRGFADLAAGGALDRRKGWGHLLPRSAARSRLNIYDAGIEAWDDSRAADLRERLRECLVSFPGLKLRRFRLACALRKVYLANTLGFAAKYKTSLFQVRVRFQSGDHQLELSESRTHFRNFDPPRLVARAANLLGALDAEPEARPGGMEFVIMAPEASAQLLKEFSPGLMLDRPGLRERALAASSRVTLLDNPALDEQPGSVPFDDEGTAAGERCLLNKGVTVAAACDIRSAFLRGQASTGNGFRDGEDVFPRVRFSNLYFKPGNAPLAQMLDRVAAGALVYLVRREGPGRLPGEAVFTAYGFRFAGGEIGRPLQFRLSASLRSWLLHVADVSRELRFFHGRANFGSSYLLLQGRATEGGFSL
jgi:predicted Zn-dependent protease